MKRLKLVFLTVLEFLEFGWQVVAYALIVVSAFPSSIIVMVWPSEMPTMRPEKSSARIMFISTRKKKIASAGPIKITFLRKIILQ